MKKILLLTLAINFIIAMENNKPLPRNNPQIPSHFSARQRDEVEFWLCDSGLRSLIRESLSMKKLDRKDPHPYTHTKQEIDDEIIRKEVERLEKEEKEQRPYAWLARENKQQKN